MVTDGRVERTQRSFTDTMHMTHETRWWVAAAKTETQVKALVNPGSRLLFRFVLEFVYLVEFLRMLGPLLLEMLFAGRALPPLHVDVPRPLVRS